ncbi:MAG: ferrochelatase [Desulfobulbaceae bacterium]|nr:ferrochelatase [Desulfobulbaceae bacterium]
MSTQTIGVVLLNMGGPERQEDVAPFLTNLFSDRDIIRLGPAFLQKPLARLIAKRRAPRSQAMYRQIGGLSAQAGGSPLRAITEAQASALEAALRQTGDYRVRVAMRYWHPRAIDCLRELDKLGARQLIALPLYPQYSRTTTGSSLADLRRAKEEIVPNAPLAVVDAWPDHPSYIAALAHCLDEGLRQCRSGKPRLLYSAHSLPQSVIDSGDPYLEHLRRTINALEKQTEYAGTLCFQSRGGPVRWLTPETGTVIEECARAGEKEILIMPISFVSDHVETLYEISILFAEQAAQRGMRLIACPSLNTRDDFIACLAELTLSVQS